MKRTKVQIEKETKKAYLVIDANGRKGWIQRRWLGADNTVAEKTLAKANDNYKANQAAYAEAKNHSESLHAITKIVRETERALAVEVILEFCDVEKMADKMIWIPKSLVKDNSVPGWFVIKKLNELLEEYRMDFSRFGSVMIDSVGVKGFDSCFAM